VFYVSDCMFGGDFQGSEILVFCEVQVGSGVCDAAIDLFFRMLLLDL